MRRWNWEGEGGLRPVGAIGAYAPEGSGNAEVGMRNVEAGMRKAEIGKDKR